MTIPPAARPTLDPRAAALGATLLPTGQIQIPADAFAKLADQSSAAARAALDLELAPTMAALGFADLGDMITAVQEVHAAPPEANPLDAYLQRAAALEYTSLDELFDTLEHHNREYDATQGAQMSQPPVVTPPPAAPAVAPVVAPVAAKPPGLAPGDDLINNRKLDEGTRSRINKLREELRGKASAAEQRATAAEAKLAAAEQAAALATAEEAMKMDLVRAGVGAQNFDYAWHALKKKIGELAKDVTPEGIKKLAEFSATTWATEQRSTAPYLFGEHVVPASTGATGGAPQPSPMGAAAVGGTTAAAGQFDARTASPADMKKRMSALGIDYKGNAPPIQR